MTKISAETPNVFARHDHRACKSGGMAEARKYCAANGLRLTRTRARVLEILLESHKALGAYEILNRLQSEGLGSQPPVVYRALEFLVENHFVHRLERLNAFTACIDPIGDHEAMFLICQDCLTVAESPQTPLFDVMNNAASALGFDVHARMVEIIGRCPSCQESASP